MCRRKLLVPGSIEEETENRLSVRSGRGLEDGRGNGHGRKETWKITELVLPVPAEFEKLEREGKKLILNASREPGYSGVGRSMFEGKTARGLEKRLSASSSCVEEKCLFLTGGTLSIFKLGWLPRCSQCGGLGGVVASIVLFMGF